MPQIKVSRSIVVAAPVEEVYTKVNDYHHWPKWSPWLITEPDATLNIAHDGKSYNWEGKLVGSGQMEITEEEVNQKIVSKLLFLKPWKSKAVTSFDFEEVEKGTKVTWHMDSSLPFFMFWMKKKMELFIGMDYERGLTLLKEYVELGAVNCELSRKGEKFNDAVTMVGIRSKTGKAAMPEQMRENFERIRNAVGVETFQNGRQCCQYHKFDLMNDDIDYSCCVSVKTAPEDLPSDMIIEEWPAMRTYSMRMKGPYHHLGNLWNAMMSMSRAKIFAQSKKISPYEVYINSPYDTKPEELITDVHFPLK